jgi:purine-cytosine permease-like protein
MFSVSSGWTTIAADYNVNMPANTPKLRTAALTFFGVYIPVTSCGAISAGLMTITVRWGLQIL